MRDTISPGEIPSMLRGAAAEIRARHELLTELDSVTGDGDHGTAMLRAMDAVEQSLDAHPGASPTELLSKAGWAVMSAAGGSTGPLLGTFFTGMSQNLDQTETLDSPALSAMIRGGIAAMQKHSKAQVGDKTMMDALLPAAESLEQNANSQPPAGLLRLAAEAAAAGAGKTRDMQAKFGRARNLGARVLGHADPGATSMSLILAGFAAAVPD